jgi:hypothetical protein
MPNPLGFGLSSYSNARGADATHVRVDNRMREATVDSSTPCHANVVRVRPLIR